jgi:hypothetical protein
MAKERQLASLFLGIVLSFFAGFFISNYLLIHDAVFIQVSISPMYYAQLLRT